MTRTPSSQPNILLVMADQLGAQRNSRIGAYDNASEAARRSRPSLTTCVRWGTARRSPARCTSSGRTSCMGFERRLMTDIYPADFGWTPNWQDPEGRFDWWFHDMAAWSTPELRRRPTSWTSTTRSGSAQFASCGTRRAAAATSRGPDGVVHPPARSVGDAAGVLGRFDHEAIDLPRVGRDDVGNDPHSERHDPVSLHDVLPTLVDLAGGDPAGDLGHPVDGGSLVPQLHGDRNPDRTVLGEYLGEGAVAPIFMIRRQNLEVCLVRPDGAQLYDRVADPDERRNLATVPDHADVAAAFRDEIDKHWQPARVHSEVHDSQRARRLVDRALRTGRYTPWDHVPTPDSANEYVRDHLDLRDVEVGRRFPRVPTGASR